MRAALPLAHLDEVDPGGRWGNRPAASLRRIFVSWSPQTYATPAQRLKVIDRFVRPHSAVGWKLLLALAPRSHDVSQPSKPNWRDFTSDEPEAVTWASVAKASTAIGARLLEQVGDDVDRWCALLDLWANFEPQWRAAAVKQLEAFAQTLTKPAEIESMRDKLRKLLQHHRGFKDAQWPMAEVDLVPLDAVFEILQPVGVEDRVRWLFRSGAAALRPGMRRDSNPRSHDYVAGDMQSDNANSGPKPHRPGDCLF